MKRFRRRGWTIGATLLTITIVPPLVMLVVVAMTLYFSRVNEIRGDIDERGRLVAASLAASSKYGVVSRNIAFLEQSVRGLLESDASIAAVEILDDRRAPLVSVRPHEASSDNALFIFERPVVNQPVLVDFYDSSSSPRFADAVASAPTKPGTTVGYVRVYMSPAPLLSAKTRSLYLTGALLAVAGLIGLVVGLLFVRRLRRPIQQVLTALRDMRTGNFSAPIGPPAPGELGQLQTTLVEVAVALATTTHELEAKVRDRTAQLEEAMQLSRVANDEKRDLIARGNKQVEEERERIAREIHDSMNASLIVLKLHIQCIGELAAHGGDDSAAQEIGRIAREVTATTDSIYAVARNIIKQLRPEVIDMLGLTGALSEMVRSFDELHPDCTFELRVDDGFPTLSREAEMTAYRLVQEALSNVVKHARANAVVIQLGCLDGANDARIVVSDNGIGFEAGLPQRGLGLVGMRERVSSIGGSMRIRSSPAGGTDLTFVLRAKPNLLADDWGRLPGST